MLSPEENKELMLLEKKEERTLLFLFFFIIVILGFVVFTIYYFRTTTLNIIAETKGVIVPSSKVKVVQHLEGGIIKKINVNVGDIVKKNAILLELEPIKTLADYSELEKRLVGLSINILRLRAESEGKNLKFNKEISAAHPKLTKDSYNLFQVRRKGIEAALLEQKNLLTNEKETLRLLEEQILISKSLLEEQLTNRLTHLDLLKEKNAIISKIENSKASVKKIEESYNTEVRTKLLEEISEYDELLERKNKYEDSLNRTLVKAPEEGIIKQRFVDTVGGIIKPGSPVFEIVPINDKLIVSSKLSVDQIGYIKKGQEVTVKLLGKNNSLYDDIEGSIVTISPDAIYSDDLNEEPYFEIRVETKKNYFQGNGEKYFMYPGASVSALIHIGERTISEYLLEPIFSSLDIALTER